MRAIGGGIITVGKDLPEGVGDGGEAIHGIPGKNGGAEVARVRSYFHCYRKWGRASLWNRDSHVPKGIVGVAELASIRER